MRINLWLVVLAVAAFPVVAAANPGGSGILRVNPSFMIAAPVAGGETPAADAALAPLASAPTSSFEYFVRRRPSRYPPRVYRPRSYRPMGPPVGAQIYFGLFNPIDDFSAGFDGCLRVGPYLTPRVQVGVALDWWHRSDDKVLELGTVRAPGGIASEELILSESTANLIPILMFVQVSGDENMPIIPYGGIGFGYEWLFLTATDYVTDESFDQVFGGFGWQTWIGASFPLDMRMRLNAEAYFNGAEVDSEVDVFIDEYGPVTVRDVIKMNGLGVRFGFSVGF